jgi:hypothetical protein
MSQDAGESMPPAGEPPSLAAGFPDSGRESVPDAAHNPAGADADALGKPEQAGGARSIGGFFAPDLPEGRRLFLWFFLAMLLFSLYLLFSLLQPFLHSIILACVFTAICHPLYQNCLILTGNRRVPAALIVLFGIALLLTVLIVVFVAGLIPQAKTTIAAVNQWLGGAHLGETLNVYIEPLLQTIQ